VETLDLLQDILGDYDGTVLLVSHDRDFIDLVATVTVAMEGDGRAVIYPGGWSDYRSQRPDDVAPGGAKPAGEAASVVKADPKPAPVREGLSFTEKKRLDALPGVIERLEAEIEKLTEFLAQPDLFSTAPAKFAKASGGLAERQAALTEAEEEWLELAGRE
ncbi:MAG: ABC transporter ATP-binding protein, partial [Paracoccus sp. (in: a-proteobacteria)]